MTYIVVEAIDTQKFVDEVNEWIGKGFKPLGGIATIHLKEEDTVIYTQAMTVDEDGIVTIKEAVTPKDIKIIKIIKSIQEDPADFIINISVKVMFMYKDKEYTLIKDFEDRPKNLDLELVMACVEWVEERL